MAKTKLPPLSQFDTYAAGTSCPANTHTYRKELKGAARPYVAVTPHCVRGRKVGWLAVAWGLAGGHSGLRKEAGGFTHTGASAGTVFRTKHEAKKALDWAYANALAHGDVTRRARRRR